MSSPVRPHYQRILVGVDGTATASLAGERAIAEAVTHGAELHIVDVVIVPRVGAAAIGAAGASALSAKVAAENARAGGALTSTQALAADAGVSATTHLVHGEPGPALLAAAAELHADLIVVGSRGLDAAGRYVLGSVPDHVLRGAPCDVLVVRTC